jgi:hypothetical protein
MVLAVPTVLVVVAAVSRVTAEGFPAFKALRELDPSFPSGGLAVGLMGSERAGVLP